MFFETPSVTVGKPKAQAKPVTPKIGDMVQQVIGEIPPAWQWQEMVAVNPYWGLRKKSVQEALPIWSRATWAETLPAMDYFHQALRQGRLSQEAWQASLHEAAARGEIPGPLAVRYTKLETWLKEWSPVQGPRDFTLVDQAGEFVDQRIPGQVRRELSDWLLAYSDQNQSGWSLPLRNQGLYRSWLKLSQHRSLSSETRQRLRSLSTDSQEALESLWQELVGAVGQDVHFDPLLYVRRLFASLPGWSSYLRCASFRAEIEGRDVEEASSDLRDFFLIRLIYDLRWLRSLPAYRRQWLHAGQEGIELRWVALSALESETRNQALRAIKKAVQEQDLSTGGLAKAFFCIDVRSEVIRRHLETQVEGLSTGGFAGFFALPFHLKKTGGESKAHFPVLLNSSLEVESKPSEHNMWVEQAELSHQVLLKSLQRSLPGGFSFAEIFGFSHLRRLFHQALPETLIKPRSKGLEYRQGCLQTLNWSEETQLQVVANALEKMGLTSDFPEFVFFFGHESKSENNAAAASLDCGACGGKSGRPNGELLADLLNSQKIREQLAAQKGLHIPNRTLFIGGVHNTTLDRLEARVNPNLSHEQKARLETLWASMTGALGKVRQERAPHLPLLRSKRRGLHQSLEERASDWSEIRPEWGLAGNALFIAAPRSMTRGVNLKGRAFLHDYEYGQDRDLSRLELILTAPVVVASWINWQYFASTVDPYAMGSGHKALHNVAGAGFCIQGNGGDLLQGLSFESVRHQKTWVHQPQRLQVIVAAPPEALDQLIGKHSVLSDLFRGEWIHLISTFAGESRLWTGQGWEPLLQQEILH